jgi:hypothetical protein
MIPPTCAAKDGEKSRASTCNFQALKAVLKPTPRRQDLPEKSTVVQVIKDAKIITSSKTASPRRRPPNGHYPKPHASCSHLHSPLCKTVLTQPSHLCLCLVSTLFPSGHSIKPFCKHFSSPTRPRSSPTRQKKQCSIYRRVMGAVI